MASQELTINLTADRVEALCNAYNCAEVDLEVTIQNTLNARGDNFIQQRVVDEENKLDIETRKTNLGSAFSITP